MVKRWTARSTARRLGERGSAGGTGRGGRGTICGGMAAVPAPGPVARGRGQDQEKLCCAGRSMWPQTHGAWIGDRHRRRSVF